MTRPAVQGTQEWLEIHFQLYDGPNNNIINIINKNGDFLAFSFEKKVLWEGTI